MKSRQNRSNGRKCTNLGLSFMEENFTLNASLHLTGTFSDLLKNLNSFSTKSFFLASIFHTFLAKHDKFCYKHVLHFSFLVTTILKYFYGLYLADIECSHIQGALLKSCLCPLKLCLLTFKCK